MPKLLLIGGNRSTIGSIRALRASGFTVALAEKLPRQYALAAADFGFEVAPHDVAGLRGVIRSLGAVDGIIGINEVAMESAAVLQDEFGLPGLPRDVIRRTGSKLAQRHFWATDPDLFVPFRTVTSAEELLRAVASVGGYPVVLKPDMSHGGSRGVSLVASEADLEVSFAFAQQHCLQGSAVIVERALDGPQFSAELMTVDGCTRVLAIGRKIKSKPPARVDLAISYPGVTDQTSITAIETMCAKAKALLGITRGPGHIEFTISGQGPRPIELGARCGGSLTPDLAAHVSGYHPMVEAARLACGQGSGHWPQVRQRGAVLMFLAFSPGSARVLHIPESLAHDPAVLDFDARLPDSGRIEPIQWTSQRVGYLGVIAQDGPTALARAHDLAATIRLEDERGDCRRPLTPECIG
jgi:hypothetical protein